MFCEADIINLNDHPELTERYAQWQHGKWGVSVKAYLDSMAEAKISQSGVPAWYAVLDRDGKIIAGLGVIENDFHKQPDLAPNVCAVYRGGRLAQTGTGPAAAEPRLRRAGKEWHP